MHAASQPDSQPDRQTDTHAYFHHMPIYLCKFRKVFAVCMWMCICKYMLYVCLGVFVCWYLWIVEDGQADLIAWSRTLRAIRFLRFVRVLRWLKLRGVTEAFKERWVSGSAFDLVAMVGVQGDTVMPSCCLQLMAHGCPVVLLAVVVSCRSN